jgi:hypothetical protein
LKQTFVLIFLTMLVPASILLPVQAQEQPSLTVSTGLNGLQEIPLKAIQSDGDIDTLDDFEIEPQHVITILAKSDFQVQPSDGTVSAVKVTDEQRLTTNLQFSKTHGTVVQGLASKAYLLDIIVEMDNGDKYLYETVLAILRPGQTLNQINTQNIIQNFVSTQSDSHTTVVFRNDDNDDDNDEPDKEEICRFTPSHPICAPNEDGECDDGFNMNEEEQCFPDQDCPSGFHRPNDDETGACISEDDLEQCPDGSWQHPGDTCFGQLPAPAPPEPEAEPECEEGFVLENGVCAALDSNCGGVPCTASDKEDSTTSDPVPEDSAPEEDTQEEQEPEPEQQEEPNSEEAD